MTLKERLAISRKVNDKQHEMDTYHAAIKANSKFSDFYRDQVLRLEAEIKTILA